MHLHLHLQSLALESLFSTCTMDFSVLVGAIVKLNSFGAHSRRFMQNIQPIQELGVVRNFIRGVPYSIYNLLVNKA